MMPISESWLNMSSNKMYKVLLQVVVNSLNEETAKAVQQELSEMLPQFSYSPLREQPSLVDCLEFMASAEVNEAQREMLIQTLDRGWDVDEEEDLYWAYGFNTKPFDPLIYYLQLEFTPIKNQ